MTSFFASARPGRNVTHGDSAFELPILYFRDDAFALFFTADLRRVSDAMPSDKLFPVTLPTGRAVVVIVAFNYIDTSIGPYGEVGIALPAVYGSKPPVGLLPGLFEGRYPGFGTVIAHLPVTNTKARDAGRGEWGYPKFVADMQFLCTPEYQECTLSEAGEPILTLHVARRGLSTPDRKPLITYSVLDGNLIKTIIPQRGVCRNSLRTRGSFLRLGDHDVAEWIRSLDLSESPFLSRTYVERSAILPAGQTVESGVRPLDGYRGTDRAGEHSVRFVEPGD